MADTLQPKPNRTTLIAACIVVLSTLFNFFVFKNLRFSLHSAFKSINDCALSASHCTFSYWWPSVAILILMVLAAVVAVLLVVYKNRLLAQVLAIILLLQLAVGLSSMLRSGYFWANPFLLFRALLRVDYLLLIAEIGIAFYAATSLGGRSFKTPLPIGKRGVSIIVAAFIASVLAIYAGGPVLWRHYQDKVVARHAQKTADQIADAFKNLSTQHSDPESMARNAGVSFVYLQGREHYQLCGHFNYDASDGAPVKDFLHHQKGRQCISYAAPQNSVYQNDIRVDKDMLVLSRKPSYQISAMSLDGDTDTQAAKISMSSAKFYTADGKESYSEKAAVGTVLTYYWRKDNLENKEEVYKVVIQQDKQDPRYCKIIDPSAVSYYCPDTTTNLTLVSVGTGGTQGDIRAKKPNGQEVGVGFEIGYYQPKVKDKSGNELPLSALKPGMRINLIYDSNTTFSNEDLTEIIIQ